MNRLARRVETTRLELFCWDADPGVAELQPQNSLRRRAFDLGDQRHTAFVRKLDGIVHQIH